DLLKNWSDGRIKMYLTWKLLNFRRFQRDLFLDGEYVPLHVTGSRQNHVIAFVRRLRDQWCVVAVPRLMAKLSRAGSPPLGEKVWQDTMIEAPSDMPAQFRHVLTNEELSLPLKASKLFATLPVCLALGEPEQITIER